MLHGFPLRAVVRNRIKVVLIEIVARDEMRKSPLISSEERLQIHCQIADHGQISQRLDAQMLADSFHECAAGQAFSPINHHSAGAAHPHAAGKTKSQIRARAALKGEDSIENARFLSDFDLMRLELRFSVLSRRASLDAHGDFRHGNSM